MSPDEHRVRSDGEPLARIRARAGVLHRQRVATARVGAVLIVLLVVAVVMAAGGSGPTRRLRTVGVSAVPAAGNPPKTTTTTILQLGTTQPPTTLTPAATLVSPKETPTPACALSMLSFAVHTDRAVYPVGTPLVITFTVRNATGATCVFDAKAAAAGAWCKPTFAVQDFTLYPWPDGVAVYEAGETPCPAGPTARLLAPGASFAETTTLDGTLATKTQYGSFDQGPGHYGLSVAWSATSAIPLPSTDSAHTTFEVVPESTTTTTGSLPASTTTTTGPAPTSSTTAPRTTG